jgi:hypothetical protein
MKLAIGPHKMGRRHIWPTSVANVGLLVMHFLERHEKHTGPIKKLWWHFMGILYFMGTLCGHINIIMSCTFLVNGVDTGSIG